MNISSKKYFADWITTIIKPCCIVYSSQKAKDIISKNNLTPSEYLRPFGDFKEFTITSPFNKQLIKSFILDFIDSEEFNSIPKDKYNTYIKALLKHNDFYPHWNANQLKHSGWKIEEMINNKKYIGFPWCNAFERMLFELLKCQKTEMYQQPIANVYMCSIDEDVSVINELKHKDNVPLLLKDNTYYFQPEINLLIVLIDKSNNSNSSNTVNIDIKKQKTLFQNQYKDTHYITFPEINKGNKVNNNEFWKNYISYINLCGLKNRSNSINSNSNNNSHSNSNSNSHSNSVKQSNIPSSFKPESPTLPVITSITSSSPKLTLYDDDDEDEEQITYGKYITNEEITVNKHIIYDFFEFYTFKRLKDAIKYSTKAINERKKSNGFLSLFKHKEKRVKYDNDNIYLLSTREKHLYYLSFLNFFFRNYAQACELLRELIGKIKSKSLLHYHFLFELHTISTVLSGEKIMLKEHLFLEILKNHLEDSNYAYALRFLVLFIKQYETKANFSDNKTTNLFVKKYKSHLLNNKIHHTHSEAFLFLVYRAMIWEKQALFSLISSYNQNHNYICKRNFAFRMFQSGKFYKDIPFENNPFLLHSYGNAIAILNSKSSLIFEKDINMLSSFTSIKQEIYQILAKVCDDMKLSEESFIFSKLSLELSAYISMQYVFKGKHKLHNQPNQPFIMNYYMKNLKDIKQNDCKLITFINYKDLLELNIVDIDNTSLYVVEHQDEEIAKRFLLSSVDDLQNYKMKGGNNNHQDQHQRVMNWSNYFSKYAITDSKQRYVHLDRRDINVIKYLDNVTSNKDPSFNSFHKKTFTANVGERLHILFTIFNPLSMDLPISSIKLIYFCTKFSNNNTNTNTNDDSSSNININSSDNSYVQSTEKKVNLKGGTKQQIRLSITSEHPCVISITGVEIVIYKDIRIQHLFSKRRVSMLYNKKPNDNCLRSTSFSDLQRDSITRYSIDREREMNLIRRRTNSIRSFKHVLQINTNKEISYEILQFNNNINITCPLGDCVECYRYQCLLYPIEIENNTSLFKIKQFSVFVYNSNHTKGKVLLTLKTFYTFNVRLNQGNKKEVVYIPIYSTEKGAIDVKVVIKFKDESMKKYIEIKRFSFRVLVKPSFEVNADWKVKMIKKEENEEWNNVYVDYWINLTMHNSNMLTDLDIKDIYTGCNVNIVNDDKDKVSQWCSNNVIKGKYYRCLTLSITDNDNNNNGMIDDKQDDEIDPDDPHLNEHLIKKDNTGDDNVMNVYPELLKCYQEKKNTIIFTWMSNQKQQTSSHTNTQQQQQQQQISGFFILDLPELHTTPTQLCKPLLTLELTQPFLQTLIENICTITLTLKPFPSNNTTLIILTLNIDCEALFPFNNIISFKTFILPNNTNLPLTWIGTTKYTHLLSTHHPNYTVNFICQTALKGTIPLNHIGILFTFSTLTHPALSTTTFKPKYIETYI